MTRGDVRRPTRIRRAAACTGTVAAVGGLVAVFLLTNAPGPQFVTTGGLQLRGGSAAPNKVFRSTVDWCGTDTAATDRPDAIAGRQFHVIYAFPSDGTDRFTTLAGPIASDVAAMDGWWRLQDPTRAPRFDLAAFPGCATGFGQLDLSRVQLKQPTTFYESTTVRMPRLVSELNQTFADPAKKYLVYYDGAVDDPRLCGQSAVSPDRGGPFAFSVVYAQACRADIGSGAITASVITHELSHNLGAVPPHGPPNACPGDSAHVCDDENDLMYPTTRGQGLSAVVLDVGRNDYYGHGQGWWDLRNSDWLVHLDAPGFALTISFGTSTGTGTVTSDQPGIACPPSCSSLWSPGTKVTLTAAPAAGSRFAGWSGACSVDPCSVTMAGPESAVALFVRQAGMTVSIRHPSGTSGKVTSRPAAISCPPTCTATFDKGAQVRLVATAGPRSTFVGWTGVCSGKTTCAFFAGEGSRVTATFHAAFKPPARKLPLCKAGQTPMKAKPCRR